jgi:acyl carrier protein
MLTYNNVLEEATEVFKDVLDNERIELSSETTADDIEEWDSLSHIQLIVALEKHFKIKFTTAEITSFKNVGQLAEGIVNKINK